jgi:2-polyprenyl-6-methoxyphenol hydroxylase-like FAD-dependent oxidoreductase
MHILDDKKIAIVGGGPGGLTLARLLQLHGVNVNVYERDVNKDVRVQGATLDLHDESGLLAIRKAGLMEDFLTSYRPGADRTRLVDQHLTLFLDEPVNNGDELSRPEIDRGPLRQLLLSSLHPGTVVWDSYLVGLSPEGKSWRLEFQNGGSAQADLVLAADGANSKVRPVVTPIRPFYAGLTAIEGAVYDSATVAPGIHELLGGGKIFAMGDEKTLIVGSKGDGSLAFYIGFKSPEGWVADCGIDFEDGRQVTEWFAREFRGWDPLWLELFQHSAYFIPRPQYCMPLDQQWDSRSNLTLLGDAAHLMPPYAGEGVNMAMLDALELSECLTNGAYPDTRTAISAYEQQMLARAAVVAKMTLEQMDSLHSVNAMTDMLALFNPSIS